MIRISARVEIERIILHDTEISLDETPGFLIGIVDQDSTYYVDFGVKSLGSDERLDMNDIFEVGSVSKVFAASLVSVMTSKGIVSYEDKINQYLPLDLQNPRMDDVTILDLVQHTSGLPVRPHFFGIKERDPQNPYGSIRWDWIVHLCFLKNVNKMSLPQDTTVQGDKYPLGVLPRSEHQKASRLRP